VGGPFDVFVYERDSLEVRLRRRLDEHDPYFRQIQKTWGEGIVKLVEQIPGFEFPEIGK
jgi:putative proteasome-type protease